MAKKVGGGGAIMQPYDKNGEYDFNEETVERNTNFKPKKGNKSTPNQDVKDLKDKTIQELKNRASQEQSKEKIEVIDSLYTKVQSGKVQNFRNNFRTKSKENALVMDDDGNAIVEREGNYNSVSFYQSEVRKMKGASLIHNHPQGNTVLSEPDIDFITDGVRTIEAIGYDGWIHSIEVLPQTNPQMVFGTEKRFLDFKRDYGLAFAEGQKKAREEYNRQPKIEVKSGHQMIPVPKNWNLYKKGASVRYYTNYVEYMKIIQNEIMEFSKTSEEKYGIKSIFRKEN